MKVKELLTGRGLTETEEMSLSREREACKMMYGAE